MSRLRRMRIASWQTRSRTSRRTRHSGIAFSVDFFVYKYPQIALIYIRVICGYSFAMRNEDREFSLIRSGRRVIPSGRLWNPAADVHKTKDGWMVKIDLAGICSDELEIEIRDSMLRITGCRRDTHSRDSLGYH